MIEAYSFNLNKLNEFLNAYQKNTASWRPDEDAFIPLSNSNGGFDLKVSKKSEQMIIPSRTGALMDCGLSLNIPKNFSFIFTPTIDWSKKGLLLASVMINDRLVVMAHNAGKQILAFNHGEVIGSFHLVESSRPVIILEK